MVTASTPRLDDSDADIAARHRVAALEYHAGEIDPGAGRGGDDDASLVAVGNPVAAGADPDLALDLGAGPGRAERTERRDGEVGRAPGDATARGLQESWSNRIPPLAQVGASPGE